MSRLSTELFQEDLGHFNSRKLLLHTYSYQQPPAGVTAPSPSTPYTEHSNFDANVVMVLSVLLCALICSLGLNSIIRCVLRCTRLVGSQGNDSHEISTISAKLANTGIKKRALKTFPTVSYWEGLKLPGLDKECVICLGDFSTGHRVKILPKCNHGFHVCCIDRWLSAHSSCPTCRHSLLETCQKIVTAGNCSSTISEQGPSSTPILTIVPLQNEGLIRNYET